MPGTLLQFLVFRGSRPWADSKYVWEDPEAVAATGCIRDALDEARRFAVAMHGAALLYNVLLAERAVALGLSEYAGRHDDFATRFDEWRREIEASDVADWDLDRLWALVAEQGRPVSMRTRSFVATWVDLTRSRVGHGLADNRQARAPSSPRSRWAARC